LNTLAPSLSANQLAAGRQESMNQLPAASSTQVNLLSIAWKSRWLILLCTTVGVATAWSVLQRATPLYTSVSRIYVERNLPRLLDFEGPVAQTGNYLNTQAQLMKSTTVLSAALEQPDIRDLTIIREADNPVGLLRNVVSASVGLNDDIINISAELPDPKEAALIVNTVVDAYITNYAEDRRTDLVAVLNILRNEKIRRDEEYEKASKRLDDFRREHIALSVQVNSEDVVSQRFGLVAQELNSTEIEFIQARARFNRVKKMYETPSQRPYLLELATANSTNLRDANLESQVREIEQQLNVELSKWGAGYPRVKLMKASLRDLEKQLTEQRQHLVEGYVDGVQQEFELLDNKRAELQKAYDEQFGLATDVSAQIVTQESLKQEVERAAENCALIDERIKQLNLTEEVGAMNVSVMEVAAPGYMSYPDRPKILGIGVAFGGLLGFGLAWLRDLMDHRLKSVDEISEATQLPVIGVIPMIPRDKKRIVPARLTIECPRSAAAEAVRTLRTGVYFGLGGNDAKVIVVTSPSPGDGKSCVASNLAIAMSQANQRVLLIDGDMRRPTQAELFAVSAETGLSDVLAGRLPPQEGIQRTELDTLDILTSGKLPVNPVELLNNGYFAEILEALGDSYDKIIIDSPPIIPVADSRVLAALGDCTLLVLRAENTSRRLCVAARDELWRVRAERIGIVVNGIPTRKQGFGDNYGYGYGYDSSIDVAYGFDDDEITRRNQSMKKPREMKALNGLLAK
jgi:capsular exopolysaccharide synthesis family protein